MDTDLETMRSAVIGEDHEPNGAVVMD
jgi:hypothetical protein